MILVAGGGLVVLMACLLPLSLRMLKRANKTALLRTPEHLVFANLKAPLPIRHIADFGLQAWGAKFNGTLRKADEDLKAALAVRCFRPARVVRFHTGQRR
jgi:hypothetical protein